MEPLLTTGIVHLFGVIGWLAVVLFISLTLIQNKKQPDPRHVHRKAGPKQMMLYVVLSAGWVGSSGIFYHYQQVTLEPNLNVEFWWTHAMVLVWVIFAVVFFLFDPMINSQH